MIDIRTLIARNIQVSGFHAQGVFSTLQNPHDPSFTYTIGLEPQWGFELLVVAMNPEWAIMGLNKLYVDVQQDGNIPKVEERDYRMFLPLPILYKKARPELVRQYVCQADNFFGKPVDVLQVVMCDKNGIFEGEPNYDAAYMARQPKLW